MLHVFPEVDSKHSESEWNQDSDYGLLRGIVIVFNDTFNNISVIS